MLLSDCLQTHLLLVRFISVRQHSRNWHFVRFLDRVLAVYEALIRTQEHFPRTPSITKPRYFGYALRCALKPRSSPECSSKPSKCEFVRPEVEYLSHVITAKRLKVCHRLTCAVLEFPWQSNVHEVRRFLGMSSHYRQFFRNFAKMAYPLHSLTCKGVAFEWSAECEHSFKSAGAFVSII